MPKGKKKTPHIWSPASGSFFLSLGHLCGSLFLSRRKMCLWISPKRKHIFASTASGRNKYNPGNRHQKARNYQRLEGGVRGGWNDARKEKKKNTKLSLAENFGLEVICANLGLKEKYSTLLKLLRWQGRQCLHWLSRPLQTNGFLHDQPEQTSHCTPHMHLYA